MLTFRKQTKVQAPPQKAGEQPRPSGDKNLGQLAEMTMRLDINPKPAFMPGALPAAWPTGVSLLAQAVEACRQCEATEVCNEWLAQAPSRIAKAPPFCPNAETLAKVKKGES